MLQKTYWWMLTCVKNILTCYESLHTTKSQPSLAHIASIATNQPSLTHVPNVAKSQPNLICLTKSQPNLT